MEGNEAKPSDLAWLKQRPGWLDLQVCSLGRSPRSRGLPLGARGKSDGNLVPVAGNSWADVLGSRRGVEGDVTEFVWCF